MGSIVNGTHRIVEPIIDVPVVIVGGGGCGLTTSIFLSDLGVEHFLFEKHPGTSRLPRAHYINQRSMEIFRQHDVAKRIQAISCPIEDLSRTDWRTPPGGDGPFDRRVLATMPAFGGQAGTAAGDAYRRDGPELSTNLPLIRLEPILRQVAEERNPGTRSLQPLRARHYHRTIRRWCVGECSTSWRWSRRDIPGVVSCWCRWRDNCWSQDWCRVGRAG